MHEAAKRFGRNAEELAVAVIQKDGLEVLARNVRAGNDEIDILARDGPVIVLVEVKARGGGLAAADLAFTRSKRQRLLRAFYRLVADGRIRHYAAVRCDLVLIAPGGSSSHIRDV